MRKPPLKLLVFTPERRQGSRRPPLGLGAIVTWCGIAVAVAAFWVAILRLL